MTHMRHRHFGSSMNKNGRLKFISPAKTLLTGRPYFSLLRALHTTIQGPTLLRLITEGPEGENENYVLPIFELEKWDLRYWN